MNTIFMNSRKSKLFDLHRLLLNFTDKTINVLLYQILAFPVHRKI